MQKPKTVIVGSLSELKRSAVQSALDKLGIKAQVIAKNTASGQNAQPYGARDTLEGARIRAYSNCEADAGDDVWCVGIESGVMPLAHPDLRFDVAFVFVRTGGGRNEVATSAGMSIPADVIDEAQQRSFVTTTIGDVIAERLSRSAADNPHAALTDRVVSRQALIEQAVVVAFAKLLAS